MEENNLKVTTAVVKVASRCNLNCTYCYMYNLGDKTYKNQPKVMSETTIEALMRGVLDHCQTHDVKHFDFVLHGGEPLLAGEDFFRAYRKWGKELLEDSGIAVNYYLQTNGVLLTQEWCELFNELEIQMGISLDGLKEDNDRYRIDHAGRGSYDKILAGLQTANKYYELMAGCLSVININADPVATYNHFIELGVPGVDFLIPEATYEKLPPQPDAYGNLDPETPYGDWLSTIFDLWFDEDPQKRFDVRTFEFLVHSMLGGDFSSDSMGNLNNEVVVVETDGSIEAVDSLKVCGHGFTKAGANVNSQSLDDALNTPLANLYHQSHTILAKKCMSCPINDVCGGGYIPHRYSEKNGFNNPSVYCKDLMKLITHVQNRVFATIPNTVLEEAGVAAVSYEEVKAYVEDQMNTTKEAKWAETLESFVKMDA